MWQRPLPLFVGLVIATQANAQTTWYVDQSGGGDFTTIQAAVNHSQNGDQIIVRDGTYSRFNFNGKLVLVRSDNGPSVTHLQGNDSNPVVVFESQETSSATLQGFTIVNDESRPGILIDGAGPSLVDLVIEDCGPGISVYDGILDLQSSSVQQCYPRGVYVQGDASEIRITKCVILNNDVGIYTNGAGLAVYGFNLTRVSIRESTFERNEATSGGAIYSQSPVEIESSTFASNYCSLDPGGAIYAPSVTVSESHFRDNSSGSDDGGAIFAQEIYADLCTFERNTAAYSGGAILSGFGRVSDCAFSDNSNNGRGGGVNNDDARGASIRCPSTGSLEIDRCRFEDSGSGQDTCHVVGPTTIRNSVFVGCWSIGDGTAGQDAGAILGAEVVENTLVIGSHKTLDNIAIEAANITNCTVVEYYQAFGRTNGGGFTDVRNSISRNCIEPISHDSNLSIEFSCLDFSYPGTGNIVADPIFARSPSDGFYFLSHKAAGQSLDSPCIDGGDPNSLPYGTTRTDGIPDTSHVDMGYHPPISAPDEDNDDDGISNNDELMVYGTNPIAFDTDGDGISDGTEVGKTLLDVDSSTNLLFFVPDADPSTTTDPLNADSDGGGMNDGREDFNRDGACQFGEFDPTQSADDRFRLSVPQLVPGTTASIAVTDARWGSTGALFYSLAGPGPTPTAYGFTFDLSAPFVRHQIVTLIGGNGTFTLDVPPQAPPGLSVWMQAVEKLYYADAYRTSDAWAGVIQ